LAQKKKEKEKTSFKDKDVPPLVNSKEEATGSLVPKGVPKILLHYGRISAINLHYHHLPSPKVASVKVHALWSG
jgi:hypothetical protein